MSRPKIHVFLGAPTLPVRTASRPEEESGQWKTLDLCLQGARLKRRVSDDEAQGSDVITRGGVSGEQSRADGVVLANEGLDRLNIDPDAVPGEDKDVPVLETEGEGAHADTDPDRRTPSRKKRAIREEQGLCPGAVKEYLDGCFPAPGPGAEAEAAGAEPRPGPSLSVETEYLSTWTTSQVLLLKGKLGTQAQPIRSEPEAGPERAGEPSTPPNRTPTDSGSTPELYSPAKSPGDREGQGMQECSQELFDMLSERQEVEGVVLEATPEGILCSQSSATVSKTGGAEQGGSLESKAGPSCPLHTSPVSPTSKKTKVSPTGGRTQGEPGHTRWTPVPVQSGPTTLLVRCTTKGARYSVLVAVVYPCHLKEIKVKSGTWAGSTVPLATIVVTDQSGVDMKVILWRTAAFWSLTVNPGDLLLITGVTLNEDKWRGELVLQSSHTSRLLNLGQLTGSHPPPAPQHVNGRTVRELWAYLCKRRPLLLSLPYRKPQDPQTIPHVRLRAMQPDTLVHALLKVTHTSMIAAWREEAESRSRTGGVQKALLTVEQGDGQQGALVLWGAAMAWLQRIQKNKGAVWEFRVLLVKRNGTTGLLELHSTPWGSCEPLFPGDKRAVEFHSWAQPRPASLEIDLRTLLSQKYTGDVEFKGQIMAFQFQGSPSQSASLLMNCDTPSQRILETVSGDVTFTGCGRCGSELDTDDNGIYRPCYPCLPSTSVRRYYRPAMLTVRDGHSEVCVQVPPVLVQKILLDTPPDRLSKAVAPSSGVRFVQVVADRIGSLLSVPQNTFLLTVRSHFLCDENSVPTSRDFLLLDIHL
ncbi:hypothetical protein MATL_G00186480 [Megalops atlanticus]|uniref:Shieldin complex subunit 2 n=1 Tax=Megalops atlanticus TaxID=7932 RepID=A0A9D3T5H7_MEGAT|nr:hypothetical protein MATL_G00186480 [Megalops atlanticus]